MIEQPKPKKKLPIHKIYLSVIAVLLVGNIYQSDMIQINDNTLSFFNTFDITLSKKGVIGD